MDDMIWTNEFVLSSDMETLDFPGHIERMGGSTEYIAFKNIMGSLDRTRVITERNHKGVRLPRTAAGCGGEMAMA
jgi:hypothetical protein